MTATTAPATHKENPKSSEAPNHSTIAAPSKMNTNATPNADNTSRTVETAIAPIKKVFLAQSVGFEPTVPFSNAGFQDRFLKPLGQLCIQTSKPIWE